MTDQELKEVWPKFTVQDIAQAGAYSPQPPDGDESFQKKPAKPIHDHYFRPAPYASMDWYRICAVFDVTHPCAQHAGKKIVFAGQRGAKDVDKDIQEAIDTLVRWQAMRAEEGVP